MYKRYLIRRFCCSLIFFLFFLTISNVSFAANYDGDWEGDTDQGLDIHFSVETNAISGGYTIYKVCPGSQSWCTSAFSASLVGDSFTSSHVSGNFTSGTSCTGTYSGYCTCGTVSGRWTATRPSVSVSPTSFNVDTLSMANSFSSPSTSPHRTCL